MPVKIRLQRHGKKGKPFYWIVAADSRAKRDGKYLEKLGIYNPNTNPATIELDIDNSVQWLQNGAQPTDTARAILSYKGAMLKHHLWGGVRKGALTEEQLEEKFNAWVEEKGKSVGEKIEGLDKAKADARKKALAAEKEVSEKRAMAAVEAELPETPENESAGEEIEALEEAPSTDAKPIAEDAKDTEVAETEAADEPIAEKADEPVAETKDAAEAPAKEEAADTPALEAVVETPEIPHPDKANADHTPVAPVVPTEVVEANEDMEKAPSVEEVMEASDEEVKPAPSAEEE